MALCVLYKQLNWLNIIKDDQIGDLCKMIDTIYCVQHTASFKYIGFSLKKRSSEALS